jgi:hypothetical protein
MVEACRALALARDMLFYTLSTMEVEVEVEVQRAFFFSSLFGGSCGQDAS